MAVPRRVIPVACVAFMAFVASRTNWPVAFAVSALVFAASYLLSLKLHPNTNCSWCEGSAKHRGAVLTYAHRPCTHCGGTGRKMRWGYRTLFEAGRRAQRALESARR